MPSSSAAHRPEYRPSFERVSALLIRFAKTGALSAGAGLLLYLGLAAFADGVRQSHLWLTLAIGGAGLAHLAWRLASTLRSGEAHIGRFSVCRRAGQPVGYWLYVGFVAAMKLCLAAIVALAAWRLATQSA